MPLVGWNATLGGEDAGGRHLPRLLDQADPQLHRQRGRRPPLFNRLSARIAVSEAAAWTGRRWYGGDYTIIPNGVDVDAAPSAPPAPAGELRILFVGRPEERKGLPILLTAFGALVEHVPCRLTVIGAEREDVLRYLADPELLRWIDIRGRVSGESLWSELHGADVLCAPSLSGESFGMVLTEAFAAGTPVIASNIAGYSDVVTDGVDGLLVPPGDPQRLAEELQRVHHEPERLRGDGRRRPRQRPALRLAARRRPGDGGLRAGDRGARAGRTRRARSPTGPGCAPPTAAPAARRRSCPRSTPPRRPPASAAAASRAGSGSASPAPSASGSPCSPRRRSASTTWSRASSARTSPGS